tara:strand:+ start:9488 stop:10051 length:564 start_codon:yes stop_codon:yes gene_type:complete
MKIGLDFDGVITNLGTLKSKVAEKLFGVNVPENKFDKEYVIKNNILTDHQYSLLQDFAYIEKEALSFMHPVRGAIVNIKKLLDDGHTLKIVTGRSGKMLTNAKEWLDTNNLSLEIVGVGFKGSKEKELKGFDVFVDDYLFQLYQIKDSVPNRFLFSWEYNEGYHSDGIAERIHSWTGLYKRISNLKK